MLPLDLWKWLTADELLAGLGIWSARIHLVGMAVRSSSACSLFCQHLGAPDSRHDARPRARDADVAQEVIAGNSAEERRFRQQVPAAARMMIPRWRRQLYLPKTECLRDAKQAR
eukprot:1327904-Pleurochrysis_carterae.AAC.4